MKQFTCDEICQLCIQYPCDAEAIVEIIKTLDYERKDVKDLLNFIFFHCHKSFRILLSKDVVQRRSSLVPKLVKHRRLVTSVVRSMLRDHTYLSDDDANTIKDIKVILSIYNRYDV